VGCPGAVEAMRRYGTLVRLVCVLGLWSMVANGQERFGRGTVLYDQAMNAGRADLTEFLKNHPDLEDVYFPKKYNLPVEYYRYSPPTDYTMNVIFDPCRGFAYNCCTDTAASPEFWSYDTDPESQTYGDVLSWRDSGEPLSSEASRFPTFQVRIDEQCRDLFTPFPRCWKARLARYPADQIPRCWNHNTTITANQGCRSPVDGSPLPLCMEVGILQSAYIVQCGGKYRVDPGCGTFLEIHRPGRKEILAQARLRGQFASGYRMTAITMTHKGNGTRSLCEGKHEMWWVQRTRHEWIVQRVIPFYIVSPRCDWDLENNRYLEYATVAKAETIFGVPDYRDETFLFARTRRTGRAGFPGKGMGSTLVTLNTTGAEQYHASAEFDRDTEFEYRYRPVRDPLTVADGELWWWHKDEQNDPSAYRTWAQP
jgi:hypothetical protein